MARPKNSEPKAASKAKPVKAGEKVPPPKDKIPNLKDYELPPTEDRKCSFCGKPADLARRLIAGPPPLFPFICDECLLVCVKILSEDNPREWYNDLYKILDTIKQKKENSPKKRAIKQNA